METKTKQRMVLLTPRITLKARSVCVCVFRHGAEVPLSKHWPLGLRKSYTAFRVEYESMLLWCTFSGPHFLRIAPGKELCGY